MTRLFRPMLGLIALAAAPSWALAEDLRAGDLMISDARAFATPKAAKSAAAYVTVTNMGEADDVLLSATAGFARTQIHRTTTDDQGVSRMRHQADGVPLPAGEAVEMAPGGLHVMFMGLEGPLNPGETRTITLIFRDAGAVEVEVPIVKRTGGHGGHAGHSGHGSHSGKGDHGAAKKKTSGHSHSGHKQGN